MSFRKLVATGASVAVAMGTVAAPATVANQPKLHAGEFCSTKKQRVYKHHGYVCKKAKDGRYRLFKKPNSGGGSSGSGIRSY